MPYAIAAVIVIAFIAILVVVTGKKSSNFKGEGEKSKNQAQIIRAANKRLAKDPHDPAGLVPMGNIYFNRQLWDKAYPIYDKLGAVIGYDTNEAATVPTYTEDDVVWLDPNKDVIAVIADKGCVFTSKQNGYTVEPIRNPRGLYNNFFANSPNNTIAYDPLYNFVIIKKSA